MPRLSFAALLNKNADVEMTDIPTLSLTLPDPDFAFDFETDEQDLDQQQNVTNQELYDLNEVDLELRSPRTPTFQGDLSRDSRSIIPFDVDRFLSSRMTSPTSGSSPLSSLTYSPAAKTRISPPQQRVADKENRAPSVPAPPSAPLPWIWTCHLCRSKYPLGATRRCLIDGHYYCSGDSSTQKNVKKKKRGQACSSEFDYVGWQEWGMWKQDVAAIQERRNFVLPSVPNPKGCESCKYPSECRYERMNKVPHVVAELSKKANCIIELEAKNVESAAKNNTATIGDKKRTLKVDTTSFSRKSSKCGKAQKGAGATLDEQPHTIRTRRDSSGELLMMRSREEERSTLQQQQPAPSSPDLVDFALMMVEMATNDVLRKGTSIVESVPLLVKELKQSSDGPDADFCKAKKSGAEETRAENLGNIPKLQQVRSRKIILAEANPGITPGRISDFFSVTR